MPASSNGKPFTSSNDDHPRHHPRCLTHAGPDPPSPSSSSPTIALDNPQPLPAPVSNTHKSAPETCRDLLPSRHRPRHGHRALRESHPPVRAPGHPRTAGPSGPELLDKPMIFCCNDPNHPGVLRVLLEVRSGGWGRILYCTIQNRAKRCAVVTRGRSRYGGCLICTARISRIRASFTVNGECNAALYHCFDRTRFWILGQGERALAGGPFHSR